MRVAMLVASDEATSGSVIANADRISPPSNGSSHCFFCSARAEQVQHLHVAGVRRGAVERGRRELDAAAGDLGERRVLQVGQPGAVLARAGTGSTARAGAPRPAARSRTGAVPGPRVVELRELPWNTGSAG